MRALAPPDLATKFLRYSFVRGLCGRGYWLAASVYLVVVADLTPAALLLIGAAQAITVLVAEVPAGVFADTVSRRLSLVAACAISGVGMTMAGLVTSFPALVVSQMLWGLGWAFASGSDIAWITDEVDRPDLIDRLLTARARWNLLGAAAGVLASGLIAMATSLATSVVLFGLLMIALGFHVRRFPEAGFTPAPADRRWRHAAAIGRGGLGLVRRDREVLLIILAWRTVSTIRATVHSLLSQSEHLGELIFGLGLAALAQATTGTTSITASALFLAAAFLVVTCTPPRSGVR